MQKYIQQDRGGNLLKKTRKKRKKNDNGQEKKKENTLSTKKKIFFLDRFHGRFLVESVFSFFFSYFLVFFNKISPQNNLEARDRYCVERDVQRHKNYWARELVKRMIIPIFPQGSERVKKPEM